MKFRALRKDHAVLIVALLFVGVSLTIVNTVWPEAFAVFIAIGGLGGATVVLYEVRLTKRIAQGEFIRDLQSGFTSDENITTLWRKLLLGEEITDEDRPLVSSYLTFFETLYLLLGRGALEMPLTDDLFRNRFFTAVGDKGVLNTSLIGHAGAFVNIHRLIRIWHSHLVDSGTQIHPGYYSYIQALFESRGYEIRRLREEDLSALVELQERVIGTIENETWLRDNANEMLEECLVEHVTIGAFISDELVAAAVLYDGGKTEESLKKYFTDNSVALDRSVNLKLVLTLPGHRRVGLGRTLVELLEREAIEQGKTEILCTIHSSNMPSRALFTSLGYRRIGHVTTKYGKRSVFARTYSPSPTTPF